VLVNAWRGWDRVVGQAGGQGRGAAAVAVREEIIALNNKHHE
jgi:hypothetical protein